MAWNKIRHGTSTLVTRGLLSQRAEQEPQGSERADGAWPGKGHSRHKGATTVAMALRKHFTGLATEGLERHRSGGRPARQTGTDNDKRRLGS
eukprot:11758640-Alexandrium_andersonii.AAC.1